MSQKRHTVDQIVAKLRKADVELGKGKKVPEVCKLLEITEQTYYLKTTFSFSKKNAIQPVFEARNGMQWNERERERGAEGADYSLRCGITFPLPSFR